MAMFYDNFARLCAQHGKAETTVCRELGMSPANAKVWRNGKEPLPSTKKVLADYFGVNVDIFDKPFPEAPLPEPPSIPVHVITMAEAEMLNRWAKLSDGDREFVMRIIETLENK